VVSGPAPEGDRTEMQRFHDALQLACELLLRGEGHRDQAGRLGRDAESAFADSSPTAGAAFSASRPGPGQMSPQAWQALR
jgi:hypothetical protein